MITNREARELAGEWVREHTRDLPELVGAILVGSTRARALDAPHPAGSDVDAFVYVDAPVPSDIDQPRHRFSPRKLAWRGVILEPSFHDARRIADPGAVLGDMFLAPAFTDPPIVCDPAGRLAALAAAVGPEVRRREHARRRLAHALKMVAAMGSNPRAPDLPSLKPCWRNAALAIGVMRAAVVPLVAGAGLPTVRRSLILGREVLREAGRDDLAEALLRLAGSAALSRPEVEALVEELWRAYDAAAAVRRTPVVMDWNVSAEVCAFEHAALGELLDGHHREAACPLLQLRTAVQGILENDADDETVAWSRVGYRRLLEALGIEGDAAFAERGAALQAFVAPLREAAEAILARAPGLVD